MIKKEHLVLTAVLILAFFLRFWQLTSAPPSLNWDEVSHGYNAYSILATGKDEWGEKFLQTSFRAFGDYKLPVYIYLTVPTVAIFGLNEWGVRSPSALAGVLAVFGTFLLTQKLFNNFKLAVVSSLLLTISPWHLLLSRAAFEANLTLTLVIFGVYFFLLGLEKYKWLAISSLLLGLSFYTYYAARVVVPILVLGVIFIFWSKISAFKKQLLIPGLIFLLFFISIIPASFSKEGQARFYWTTILDQGAINQINEARANLALPPILARIFYNKVTYFVPTFFENWLSHFSTTFLFTDGGSNFQYSIPKRGLLYFFEIPLIIFGIATLVSKKSKEALVILLWLIIGPVAASLTRESPNVLRSILTLPTYQIVAAAGFLKIAEIGKKFQGMLVGIFLLAAFVSTLLLLKDYWTSYRENYSWSWQYGYKEVVNFVLENQEKYDQIIFSKRYGEPHIFYLFWSKYPPEKYFTDPNLIRYERTNWFWVDRFGKFYFVNDWEVKEKAEEFTKTGTKSLIITTLDNHPNGARILDFFKFLDGQVAFEAVEFRK